MTDVVGPGVPLRQWMVEFQQQLALFTTEQKQKADTEARSGQRMLDEDKENLLRAHEELSAIHGADETLSQRAKEDSQQIEELRRNVQRLTAILATLPPEEQQLRRQYEQQRLLLQERERAFQQNHLQNEQKLSELQKGGSMYKKWLGLEFERVEDERLRIVFTHVDPQAPTRAFTFYVYVDSSDRYHVVKCEPEVHDVQSLVDALNTSNDFSAFVRNMRKRFQQLV